MKTVNYQVTELALYLSEVGDGDPALQFTPDEECQLKKCHKSSCKMKNNTIIMNTYQTDLLWT